MRKMLIAAIFVSLVLISKCEAESALHEDATELKLTQLYPTEPNPNENEIGKAIKKIEALMLAAYKTSQKGIAPLEDTEKQYKDIIATLDEITSLIKDSDDVYMFLKAEGLYRVISANLQTRHAETRDKTLILLKLLFDVAPATTNSLMPINVVDKLLDIFENDGNLALKARSLDVLHKWLPNNPKVQARVMKMKGLEPFYHQVHKLDVTVIQTLLDLFNKILSEHVIVRGEAEGTKTRDGQLYQRIALLEHLATADVCNGLMNILHILWSYNTNENVVKTILDTVKNIKPFCLNIYKNTEKSIKMFEAVHELVTNEDKRESFEKLNMNMTDVVVVVSDYITKLKNKNLKDEF